MATKTPIARGDTYEQRKYLKTQTRKREQLMRQFCHEGPQGNSQEFQDGWERIWGHRNG